MKFYCMSRDFRDGSVEFTTLNAEDEHEAWDIVEEGIASNVSQDWLFSEKEWDAFMDSLKNFTEDKK